jgi:pimeloyl-ACP methyl ester carboxylesterase
MKPVASLVTVAVLTIAACTNGDDSDATPSDSTPTVTNAPAPTDIAPELAAFYEQRPRWSGCGGDFECATIEVPLDYDEPGGDTIELAVVRLPASDPSARVGSLLINPGGPGGSGIDYARQARDVLSDRLRSSYDVVGWDPRGVGESTAVDCLGDRELDVFLALDGSPDSASEVTQLDETSQDFAQACEARSGELLPHVGTADAARDMDVLRGVLGDEKLNYLGKSYGTFLGAIYSELFPSRVGRLVLDGAIDPSAASQELGLAQAAGFERALDAFVADCLDRSDCPIGGTEDEAKADIASLLDTIDRSPLPTNQGDRRLTQALAILGIAAPMYDEASWPYLRPALEEAMDGDGSTLLAFSDIYTDRESDGTYSNNGSEAIYAVNCLDRPDDTSPEEIAAGVQRFEEASAIFGDYLAWSSLPCRYWPAQGGPETAPHEIAADGADPILVVGTTRDPATPYEWAEALASQLSSGVLLTYEGDGHTAYYRGSDCIDGTVDDYLITGQVPEDGKRCD